MASLSGGRAQPARRALVRVREGASPFEYTVKKRPDTVRTFFPADSLFHYHARMARRAQHLRCSLGEKSERAENKLDNML